MKLHGTPFPFLLLVVLIASSADSRADLKVTKTDDRVVDAAMGL